MPDFEESGYTGFWLPGRRVSGQHGMVIVVRRRFDVDLASADCLPSPDQAPVRPIPEFVNEDDPKKKYDISLICGQIVH